MFWYSWGPTKTFLQNFFFLGHKQKHPQKLALPIADENCHKIAFWYNTYIRQKKVLVGCKDHHLPALISSYLAGDNTSSKKLPATKDSTL
jgi:hypothetical protein